MSSNRRLVERPRPKQQQQGSDMLLHGEHGAAWRRRQRRLRSWWRHEQQSVAMALSAAAHSHDKVAAGAKYDGLRAQTTDRAGEAAHRAPRRQRTRAAGEAVIFGLVDEDTAGLRPGFLAEPRPQERVQRHTMEHIVDFVCCPPMVQILDDPVPQTVEQLQDMLQFFDRLSAVPEPVIEVPKIYTEDVPMRAVLRATQLVEQLDAIMAQRTVEQNVDIPAVGGSGTGGGPSGFLPGQNYSVTAEQIVDNPVRPVGAGDLEGCPRGQGSTAFSEQIPEFPNPGGSRQDFQPVQGPAASSSDLPGQPGQGVFRTFPQNKKSATQPPHSRSELPPHSSPWTPAAYDASMVLEEEEEEEDFEVEYVEFDNRLWGREWDPVRQQ